MQQYVKEFSGLPVDALRAALQLNDAVFKASELYEVASDSKTLDESLRRSSYRALTDPALFERARELLAVVSARDPLNVYRLVANNVTHIRYDVGGFFKKHSDYLAMTSNAIEEYTLIICVTSPNAAANTVGGETRVEVSPHFALTSKATTTPGCALLFRKDLQHESLPLLAGAKEIATLNVWAVRKASATIVHVTFEEGGSSGSAPLQALSERRSFALGADAVRAFPGSALAAKLDWMQQQVASTATATSAACDGTALRIIEWQCRDCSYDAFAVVYAVLQRLYVRPCDLVAHGHVLDFFGIPLSAVLVDIANTGNAGRAKGEGDGMVVDAAAAAAPAGAATATFEGAAAAAAPAGAATATFEGVGAVATAAQLRLGLGERCCSGCGRTAAQGVELQRCGRCHAAWFCNVACQRLANATHKVTCRAPNKSPPPVIADEDIVVCTTDERARIVAAAARELGLPYVRFRVLLAEGQFQFGGDAAYGIDGYDPEGGVAVLHMAPVWATLGDHDSLLGFRKLMTFDAKKFSGLHENPLRFDFGRREWEWKDGERKRVVTSPADLQADVTRVAALEAPGARVDLGGQSEEEEEDAAVLQQHTRLKESHSVWVALKYAPLVTWAGPTGAFGMADIVSFLMPGDNNRGPDFPRLLALPGAADSSAASVDVVVPPLLQPLFHVDPTGATSFSAAEAALASAHIIKSCFLETIVARIKTIGSSLQFPQQRIEASSHFCNEDIYGKVNVLEVCGVVRLPPASAADIAAGAVAAAAAAVKAGDDDDDE